MVTTCPNCHRPLMTAEEWDALPDSAFTPVHLCRADIGYDAMCARLSADLRAKAEAHLLALARRLVAHLGTAPLVEVADLLDLGDTPEHAGQTADDHLRHAIEHLSEADRDVMHGRDLRPDPSSGRSQFAHGAARSLLGLRCVIEAEGGGRGK